MAHNDKGKALYIGSHEDKKIPKELREKILNWLREQKYYYEELLGVTEEKQEAADTGLSEVDDLEKRITNIEVVFKHLKDRKEMDDAKSSGSC